MDRDELVKLLLAKFDNLPIVIVIDGTAYNISEENIFQCHHAIVIQTNKHEIIQPD